MATHLAIRRLIGLPLLCSIALAADNFDSALKPCPVSCQDAGLAPANWTAYHTVERLSRCNDTLMLDLAVNNPLADQNTHVSIRACTGLLSEGQRTHEQSTTTGRRAGFTMLSSGSLAKPLANLEELTRSLQIQLSQIPEYNDTLVISHADDVTIGLQAGPFVTKGSLKNTVLPAVLEYVQQGGIAERTTFEYCPSGDSSSGYLVGLVFGFGDGLPAVQEALGRWSQGLCQTASSAVQNWKDLDISTLGAATNATDSTATLSRFVRSTTLTRRADCRTIQIQSGDSCGSLASRCGISGDQFMQYNTKQNLCSTLAVGQYVCCSSGSLPDRTPKPQPDGTCATRDVVSGDSCSAIASANSITIDNIESWNKNTWQFMGCNNLQVGQRICLSTGNAPMPAPVVNAVCGPQVPYTATPANISQPGALASLNECPLKACCNIWGQCGTTDEFCTMSKSASGAPGTAAPGQNGCISNCGTDIISSGPPAQQMKIGYFEGWNMERACMQMDALNIPRDVYTHIHFGFANITTDYRVQLQGGTAAQFNTFRSMSGFKKILSFGGWSFSTNYDSYPIFRKVVTAENRKTFILSLVQFMNNYNIDGFDFDWEYPGAPDIPNIPAGDPQDGQRYLEFLKDIRSALPSDKTVSIAVPASFWYLKGFPIAEMVKIVDYMVYMTYDLHGQWDYDNKWSSPGCPAGNCLRSHVNFTETINALSMITKAGVPSNKIAVGVTSYGRAFKMTSGSCSGPMCTFTGPLSGATPGQCTGTAGYIGAAEIDDIIKYNQPVASYYDQNSNSDMIIYGGDQWVAYMSEDTKSRRSLYYKAWNFAGTSDWAIDLQTNAGVAPDPPLPDQVFCTNTESYFWVEDVLNDFTIPEECAPQYLVHTLANMLTYALLDYDFIMQSGYQDKYSAYWRQVRRTAPEQYNAFYHKEMDDYVTCLYSVGTTDDNNVNSFHNETGGCPPNQQPAQYTGDIEKYRDSPDTIAGGFWNIYFQYKDQPGFCDKLQTAHGVDCTWITDQKFDLVPCREDCDRYAGMYVPWVNKDFSIPDPADMIRQSLSNFHDLADWLREQDALIQAQVSPVLAADVVDAISLTVFTVNASVIAMQKVADIGEEARQEEIKEIVLAFFTAVAMLLPGVGQFAGRALQVVWLGRIAALIADGTNFALTIYGIVEDPESAPAQIAGALLGGAASRDAGLWKKAANVRRSMKDDIIKGFGADVAGSMGKIATKMGNTCKR